MTRARDLGDFIADGGTPELVVDTTTLVVDSTNNRVGVGTASPSAALDVTGDVSIADKIIHTGDTNTAIRFPAADTVTVETGGSEVFRIDSDGNVGIGGAASAFGSGVTTLQLKGLSSAKSGAIRFIDNDGTDLASIFAQNDTTYGLSIGTNGGTGDFVRFHTGALGTERMRIDSSGFVGISNTSPSSLSAAARDLVIGNGSGSRGITIYSADTNSGNLFFADGTSSNEAFRGYVQYNHTADYINLGASGDDRVRVFGSGNLQCLGGKVLDQDGDVRAIPQSGSDKTSSYTLTTGDVGNFIGIGSGGSITVPNSTFSAGDAISIFNNTSGDRTITLSITTAYLAGEDADKNSLTLATRGVCTILFISGTVCVVTGNVS